MTRVQKLERQIAALQEELIEARKRTVIRCVWCGRGTQVRSLVFAQTHFYISPYGYSDKGEGRWDCPKCGSTNRLVTGLSDSRWTLGPETAQHEIETALSLKRSFKAVVKLYPHIRRTKLSER